MQRRFRVVIKEYINEYIRITLFSIKSPEAFFREIPDKEKNSIKPSVYLILSLAVVILFRPEILSMISGAFISVYNPMSYLSILLILLFMIAFILSLSLIYITMMHFVVLSMGGKGKFEDTFMVFCYSVSLLNMIWILNFFTEFPEVYDFNFGPWILSFSLFHLWIGFFLYMLFTMITGISVRSGITKIGAFGAAIFQPLVILLVFVFISGITQPSYNHGIESPVPQEVPTLVTEPPPQRYNLIAFLGSAPVIDGKVNDNDAWTEGAKTEVNAKGKYYSITTKHDRENLYILIQWQGTPQRNEIISLFFEQDSGRPDSNFNTGRVDAYFQINTDDPPPLVDGHYESGFISDQHQDGSLKVDYYANKSEWIQEWKIPLNSGDKDDIFVDKYPAHIGFSIINEREGEGGILPSTSYKNSPWTWANLEIVDVRKP